MRASLTLSSSWTGPGPTATTSLLAGAASATGSGTWVRAVAAAAAPEPLRKSRRDNPGPFLLRPCESFIGRDPPLVWKGRSAARADGAVVKMVGFYERAPA